jgi:hypothetical protein
MILPDEYVERCKAQIEALQKSLRAFDELGMRFQRTYADGRVEDLTESHKQTILGSLRTYEAIVAVADRSI